jgi:hypothetical protein
MADLTSSMTNPAFRRAELGGQPVVEDVDDIEPQDELSGGADDTVVTVRRTGTMPSGGLASRRCTVPDRLSGWILAHPIRWALGSGVLLVLLGFALDLEPVVIIAAGTAIGLFNILHARKRGYCPRQTTLGSERRAKAG